MDERREALAEGDRDVAREQRHQLAISPHIRLASGERLPPPCARSLQVVTGEQWKAAGRADEMTFTRINGPAPQADEHSR